MVYIMKIQVDGACRHNGRSIAIGGVGAVIVNRWGKTKGFSNHMDNYYNTPTNQRAELTAIIFALEIALSKRQTLRTAPKVSIRIFSDSKYAVDSMTEWIHGWRKNGWMNSGGLPVSNQDLLQEISKLMDTVAKEAGGGLVRFFWIPREENVLADKLANQACDEQ